MVNYIGYSRTGVYVLFTSRVRGLSTQALFLELSATARWRLVYECAAQIQMPHVWTLNLRISKYNVGSDRDVKLIFVSPLESVLGDTKKRALFGETGGVQHCSSCLLIDSANFIILDSFYIMIFNF